MPKEISQILIGILLIFNFFLCSVDSVAKVNEKAKQYYSLLGEDKYVNEQFFHNKDGGFFVDIGANDGITQSNTFFFEKTLGWKGICVEPVPSAFEELRRNRNCFCVQGCVSNYEGTAEFMEFDLSLVSGLVNVMDPRHLQRWGRVPHKIITVPCYLPMNILSQYDVCHIDYLSVDTEGGEFEILSSIDFTSIEIDIINVEVRWPEDTRIHDFLIEKGFVFVKRFEKAHDDVYVNSNSSYANFVKKSFS